ncbi:MAG TPA: diacylglycerol kinase family protein [Virgibacillus sp.]|nr:diacylglycerol kinase family protein [Virgibacillus sp.]
MKDNKRLIGLSFAWQGLIELIKEERNFKIHLAAASIVIIVGMYMRLNYIEWAVICMAISIVLISEALNSAVERIIDYVKPEIHPLAKSIKDISAAAVLIAAIFAVLIGLFIFLPKLSILLN